LAVFQGVSEEPISGFIRVERATRKNSQLTYDITIICETMQLLPIPQTYRAARQ